MIRRGQKRHERRTRHRAEDVQGVVETGDAIRAVPEPEHGPVTAEVVETLRNDPELAEVADIAERYKPA